MSEQASGAKPFCDNCLKGFLLDGTPRGELVTDKSLGDMTYYVAKPQSPPAGNETKAILIGTDFFGLGIPNPKLIADQMADQSGITVYIPDFFEGDYPNADKLDPAMIEEPIKDLPFYKRWFRIGRFLYGVMTVVGPGWMKRNSMEIVVPKAEKFCADLRAKKGIKTIGMVGYCYGGTVAVKLANAGDQTSIDTLVPIHAGSLKMEEYEKIKQPFLCITSGEDLMFDSMREDVVALLKKKKEGGQDVEYVNYPGTVHGYAARPNLQDPIVKEAFEETGKQTVEWFKKHL